MVSGFSDTFILISSPDLSWCVQVQMLQEGGVLLYLRYVALVLCSRESWDPATLAVSMADL